VKYDMLYPPLVERIYNEETQKHKKSADGIKAAKTRLHLLYGAYNSGNIHKKADALLTNLENGADAKETATAIMKLHASTNERLLHLDALYAFIEKHTGTVESVLDLGCGFNPFSVLHMPLLPKTYHAYDIDMRTKDLLNRFFSVLKLPQTADCADLAVETPTPHVDLALMSKLIPVLESQSQGRGFALANNTNAKFLVITYPLKSLGGREKGMGKNYAAQFESAVTGGKLKNFVMVDNMKIGSELVYIMMAKNLPLLG